MSYLRSRYCKITGDFREEMSQTPLTTVTDDDIILYPRNSTLAYAQNYPAPFPTSTRFPALNGWSQFSIYITNKAMQDLEATARNYLNAQFTTIQNSQQSYSDAICRAFVSADDELIFNKPRQNFGAIGSSRSKASGIIQSQCGQTVSNLVGGTKVHGWESGRPAGSEGIYIACPKPFNMAEYHQLRENILQWNGESL